MDIGVGKWSYDWLTLLNEIEASTEGFREMLSSVLAAEERSLSFMNGRPVVTDFSKFQIPVKFMLLVYRMKCL